MCSAKENPFIASMGIYVMKATALKELLNQHMPDANDFGNEVCLQPIAQWHGVTLNS